MRTGVLVAAGAGLVALGVADAAYRLRDWGASDGEVRASLTGDELLPDPADTTTLAVGVGAPAPDLWSALAEQLAGVAGRPDLGVGAAVPPSVFGTPGALLVTRVDPGRAVVLVQGTDVVRSLHVVPTAEHRCRLLARTRVSGRAVVTRVLDPVSVLATRRLLLAVATRAERATSRTAVTVR